MTTYQPPIILNEEELSPISGRKRRFLSYDQDLMATDNLEMAAKRRNVDLEYEAPGYILGNTEFHFNVDSDNNDLTDNFCDSSIPSPSLRLGSATPGLSPSPGQTPLSDHIKDMCNCQCNVCGKIFVHHRMLKHIERTHKLPAKDKFTFLRVTNYKCKLCSSELLFSFYTIGQHARSRHQMTLQQYRDNVVGAFQGDLNLDQALEDSSSCESGEKEVTDNLVNMCQVKCFVCGQKMYLNSLKRHLQKDHEDCDLEFPHKIEFLKRTYYKCKICESLVLFHFDAINKHLSVVHNSTMHAYKNQFTAFTGDKEYKSVIKQADKEKARQNRLARQDAAASSPVAPPTPKPAPTPQRNKYRPKFVMDQEEIRRWEVTLNNTVRYYSNNLDEVCVRRCRVCGEMMYADSLKAHIYQHHRGAQENTESVRGGNVDYVRLTYHKCKVCGKDLKFTVNSITKHTKRSHNVNFKEYSQQYEAFDKINCDLNDSTSVHKQSQKKGKKGSPKQTKGEFAPFCELSNKDKASYTQTIPHSLPQQTMSKENGFVLSNYRFRNPVPREFLVNTPYNQQPHSPQLQRPLQPQQQFNQQQNYVEQSTFMPEPSHFTYQQHGDHSQQPIIQSSQHFYLPVSSGQGVPGSPASPGVLMGFTPTQGHQLVGMGSSLVGQPSHILPDDPPKDQILTDNNQLVPNQHYVLQDGYQQQALTSQNHPSNSMVFVGHRQQAQPIIVSTAGAVHQFGGNIPAQNQPSGVGTIDMKGYEVTQMTDNRVTVKTESVEATQQYPAQFVVKSETPEDPLAAKSGTDNNGQVTLTGSHTGFSHGHLQPTVMSSEQTDVGSSVGSVFKNSSQHQYGGGQAAVKEESISLQGFGEVKIKTESLDYQHHMKSEKITNLSSSPFAGLEDVGNTAVSPLAGLDDETWYDGNTFQCLQCGFISKSLDTFNFHVQDYHKKCPSDWSSVSRSNLNYTCQICRQQVYHEKSVISHHLSTFHSLDLQSYASIYELPRF